MSSTVEQSRGELKGPSGAKRLAFVDALRGLAVLGVIMIHVSQMIPNLPHIVAQYAFNGCMGVQLFYVASAFTLFLSLRNRKASEKNTIRNFFIRRFFRIAPLFYAGIVTYLLLDGLGPRVMSPNGVTFANVVATSLFLHGLSPYWINTVVPGGWSIAVEMMFYLMVPLLFARVRTLRAAIWCTVAALVLLGPASMWAEHFLSRFYDPTICAMYVYYWLPRQLCVFGLGLIFYHLFTSTKLGSPDTSGSGNAKPLGRWLMLAFLVMLVVIRGRGNVVVPEHFLYGIAFVVLAASLALHPTRILVNKVICYVGEVSYSCYITHFAVMRVLGHVLKPLDFLDNTGWMSIVSLLMLFVIASVVTVGVSTLTYRLIERPGQSLGRRLIIAGERSR